jgi:hypothetical protein
MNVLNLDVLKPEPKTVTVAGHEIDVSFIPVGITFEMDDIFRRMQSMKMDEVESGGDESKRAIDLAIDLCGIFCGSQVKELDSDWFRRHCSDQQIIALVDVLKQTLVDSLKGVQRHPKNLKAAKTKN